MISRGWVSASFLTHRSRATIDIVDLVSFREVALWIIGLLLLISLFGHLEHLICKTLESVVVPGLVLSVTPPS
jgi:hypothetical protein